MSYDKEKTDCIEVRPLDKDIAIGDKAKDGSQLRPYIVWFGEPVPNMKVAMNTAFEADIFVVIGTSLLVSPANTLTACSGAGHNIVIDPGEVERARAGRQPSRSTRNIPAEAGEGIP